MHAPCRWLRYHRSIGIYHIFVHVEDTPELLPVLAQEEFADFLTVTSGNDNSLDTHNPNSADNYYTLMQRQERQVRRSVAESRTMGLDWLFHVDDDELLYFDTPFCDIVKGLSPGVSCVVLVNIEAVPKALRCDCVFEVSGSGELQPQSSRESRMSSGGAQRRPRSEPPTLRTSKMLPLALALGTGRSCAQAGRMFLP